MNQEQTNYQNLILNQIVLEALKKEIFFVQKGLVEVANNYAFLQGHDKQATKQMLIDIFLSDAILENESDEIVFSEEEFYKAIPADIKKTITDAAFKNFLNKMNVEDLKGEPE